MKFDCFAYGHGSRHTTTSRLNGVEGRLTGRLSSHRQRPQTPTAGDAIFTAQIPGNAFAAGQMVR
jgi:hypothetical protein